MTRYTEKEREGERERRGRKREGGSNVYGACINFTLSLSPYSIAYSADFLQENMYLLMYVICSLKSYKEMIITI